MIKLPPNVYHLTKAMHVSYEEANKIRQRMLDFRYGLFHWCRSELDEEIKATNPHEMFHRFNDEDWPSDVIEFRELCQLASAMCAEYSGNVVSLYPSPHRSRVRIGTNSDHFTSVRSVLFSFCDDVHLSIRTKDEIYSITLEHGEALVFDCNGKDAPMVSWKLKTMLEKPGFLVVV